MDKIKIIKRSPLSKTEILAVTAHVVWSFFMWLLYNQNIIKIQTLKDIVNMYLFVMPMLLVGLFFRNLRNFNFYFIWLIIGIIQVLWYPKLVGISDFQFVNGSAFSGLISLLPTIIMYQLLRVIFIKTHNMEMIISIRQHRMSRWEEEENRNMTWLEVGFSVTLLLTAVFSSVIG